MIIRITLNFIWSCWPGGSVRRLPASFPRCCSTRSELWGYAPGNKIHWQMKYNVDVQNLFYQICLFSLACCCLGGLCSTNEARVPSQMARSDQNSQKPFTNISLFSLEHLTTIHPSSGSETLRTLARVVVECWHHSPPVRLTALRVKKTLARWTQITHTLYFVLWTFISSVSLAGYLAPRLKI